ncbi:MAG: site-specific tyrosine recombinase XerC [Methanoregulaceae archaeon PtaB.Bin009]|jgi:integrase|nr:MAG: site-specific tyrosine recombinase XerC [Methanoregulaceae archaeon PtaB.Bin009]OPY42379.1 MAG: site-specific tyrosine recombinase XerC [Methanoregulaceae archaeon PtaU1.Bin066]
MVSIQEFIEELRTKSTKTTYRAGVYAFLDWKYGRQRAERKASPEEMDRYEDLVAQYLATGDDVPGDLRKYAASMQEIPPKTAAIRLTGIKEYLLVNGIELSERETRLIRSRMPRGGTQTTERDLTPQVLQTLLTHADVKGRALILFLMSSGVRIGEAVQLKVSDIDLERDPAVVHIRAEITKTRRARTTFISHEAVAAVREWQKVREAYLESASSRNKGLVAQGIGSVKTREDQRLFPFATHVAQSMWRTILKNADLAFLDEATGRHQHHIHQLRKYFRTQMAISCPVDVVEAMLGHEGYLTSAYRRYTIDQLAEAYKKAEPMITLQLPSTEIHQVEQAIRKEMAGQQQTIMHLVVKNEELERELKTVKGFMEVVAANPDVLVRARKK